MIFTSISCATPQTKTVYVTVKPREISLPSLNEYTDKTGLEGKLDLISQPQTVEDILHNMSEYRNGYYVWKTYGISLEKYINEIKRVIDDYNKEISNEGI